jgi:hypothetical protein
MPAHAAVARLHRLVFPVSLLAAASCVAEVGDTGDPLGGTLAEGLSPRDCYPEGNRFNCRPPDGDPGYAPRVYDPETRSEWWPIARGAHLRDGLGNVRGIVADDAVRVNLGMRKPLGGVTHVYAWTVRLDTGGASIRASGWVREGALDHAETLRRRMDTLHLPDPGEGEYEARFVITGGDAGRYGGLKVTRGFSGGGREATDYLTRDGGVVNLIYNTPGREMGGYSVDTFPLGATFHRSRGVRQIDVPLYRPGSRTVADHLYFLYGFVWDGDSRRYGWLAREATTIDAPPGTPAPPEPGAPDDTVPAEPPPTEPAPPAPPPAPTCYARCCDDALFGPLAAGDGGSCTSSSSGACDGHGYVLRARWGESVVYERDNFCWAKCRARTAYHRVDGVTTGCTDHARAYCDVGDRGGLQDAMWSQCEPR